MVMMAVMMVMMVVVVMMMYDGGDGDGLYTLAIHSWVLRDSSF